MSQPLTRNKHVSFDQMEGTLGLALRLRADLSAGRFPNGTDIASTRLHAALDRWINAYEAADFTLQEAPHHGDTAAVE